MFPTRYKSKLSKALSYPMGAKEISDALVDAPNVREFELWFSEAPIRPASAFQRVLREALPYKLVVAEYRPATKPNYSAANFLIERGWYDPKWKLQVYPVLRQLRQPAAKLLHEQGFPAVLEWLRLSNRAGWDSRHHSLALMFNPAKRTLTAHCENGV